MLTGRYVYSLSLSERLALRRQWLRSGQCIRCFRASTLRRAENDNTAHSTPYNTPQRGPTRQQRAAMISKEVKIIQRDHPSPTFSEPDPDTLRPPGASKTVDPEMMGENVTPGRMGQNDSPTHEGPLAQGVGRVVGGEDNVPDTSKMARGARSPNDIIEEPTRGGASVLEGSTQSRQPESSPSSGEQVDRDVKAKDQTQDKIALESELRNSSAAPQQFRREMRRGTFSISTIAGGRFDRVIADQSNQARRKVPLARKKRSDQTPKIVVKKVVAGRYDENRFLSDKKDRQPALNEIARVTAMNGTYMPQDTGRFLTKVRSLLPAAQPERDRAASKNV